MTACQQWLSDGNHRDIDGLLVSCLVQVSDDFEIPSDKFYKYQVYNSRNVIGVGAQGKLQQVSKELNLSRSQTI